MSLTGEVLRELVKDLYQKLSESIGQNPEEFHYDYCEIREGRLYYENMNRALMTKDGKLKTFSRLKSIIGKNRLHNLSFNIPMGKPTPRQAVMLNKAKEKLPSTSDIANVDYIELQQIMENASRSMENLVQQLEGESS